jgi:hypothetical protein
MASSDNNFSFVWISKKIQQPPHTQTLSVAALLLETNTHKYQVFLHIIMLLLQTISFLSVLPALISAQCPGVCADGSNVTNGDKIIPFFNLNDTMTPTCGEVETFAREARDNLNLNCNVISEQGGFCGCAGMEEPVNACQLCNVGEVVGLPDKITPQGDTCADIATYVSFLSSDACEGTRGESILAFDALCGCPGATASCNLCAEGREVADPDQEVFDGKCGEISDLMKTYTSQNCMDSDRLIKVNGVRCGCRDVEEFPACSITRNALQCTTDLLDAADEDCECYNFCDGAFLGCSDFPGDLNLACDGFAVSGCNYASAVEPQTSGSDTLYHSKLTSLMVAACLWMVLWG